MVPKWFPDGAPSRSRGSTGAAGSGFRRWLRMYRKVKWQVGSPGSQTASARLGRLAVRLLSIKELLLKEREFMPHFLEEEYTPEILCRIFIFFEEVDRPGFEPGTSRTSGDRARGPMPSGRSSRLSYRPSGQSRMARKYITVSGRGADNAYESAGLSRYHEWALQAARLLRVALR